MSKEKSAASRRREVREEAQCIDFTISNPPVVRRNVTEMSPHLPSANSPLHLAAACGNVKKLKKLLEEGVHVNSRDDDGSMPLHVAARLGQSETLSTSLDSGAAVNAHEAKQGRTALNLAASHGHEDIVILLLGKGADANSGDHSSSTPLHGAARIGHLSIVKHLLRHNAHVDARDENRVTPLMIAVWLNHMPIVRRLINNGAKVDQRLIYSSILLHRTLQPLKASPALQILLEEEVSMFLEDKQVCDNTHILTDPHAYSCGPELHDFTAVVIFQAAPLHLAALHGYEDAVDFLIKRGGHVDVRSKHGETPLHCAVTMGHLHLVRLLISKGADVNARTSSYGCTPLHMACYLGHKSIVNELLANSADIDVKDIEGRSPMVSAVLGNQKEIMSLLCDRDARAHPLTEKNESCSQLQLVTT